MIRILRSHEAAREEILSRGEARVPESVERDVREILAAVRAEGDAAVMAFNAKFGAPQQTALLATREEIEAGYAAVDEGLRGVLARAKENIETFHRRQKREGFIASEREGIVLGQRILPIARAGLYVPGGTASYPSTVLMNAIPAKIAGVPTIVMATPPGPDGKIAPAILAAAKIAGVTTIVKAGGAQAIAALAYGTQSVPRVDKIVGPGNIYVATAKRQVYGQVDIDMIAGPSEILILADETANPVYLAADLMSQAEHDRLASAILVTTSERVAADTVKELGRQVQALSRKEIIEDSLQNYGAVFICDRVEQAVDLVNELAPEHLEVMLKDPMQYIGKLDNAGSVFLGQYSPEPLGDYYAGPNHVLPTSGTARFFSPLSVDAFIKKSSYICYTEEALYEAKDDIMLLANKEHLTAHANSIRVRF